MIILDTCALVWMTNSPDKLSKPAGKAIRANADALCVLPISAWEIAMKIRNGTLAVGTGLSVGDWYEKVVDSYGLREIPLTAELLCASVQLPPVHRDPCDRMIIAAAMLTRSPVVTADTVIANYPKIKIIW